MKNILVAAAFLALVFLLPMASASTITRSFSKNSVSPGETVSVRLDVAITAGESYYLIDEEVPSGWTIVNPDPQTEAGHVKWVVFQGAASTSYTYQAVAPQTGGTYAFSGTYMFEGMKTESPVQGQDAIAVQSTASRFSYEGLVAPVIIVAGLVISLVIYKSRYGKRR